MIICDHYKKSKECKAIMSISSIKRIRAASPCFSKDSDSANEFSNIVFLEKYNLHYNLDEAKITNEIIDLHGWLYSDSCHIQKMGVFIGNSEGIAEYQIPWGIRRLDVYSIKKSENAQSSGWKFSVRYSAETNIRVYIYCVIENEIVPLEIRDIISNQPTDIKNTFEENNGEAQRYVTIDSGLVDSTSRAAIKEVKKLTKWKSYELFFNHNIGGGASSYLNRMLKEKNDSILVSYDMYCQKYRISVLSKGDELVSYQYNSWDELLKLLIKIKIVQIIVNELATYPSIYKVLQDISQILCSKSVRMQFMLHDYYCLCPEFDLIGINGVFCGLPEKGICNQCAESKDCDSIGEWRKNWQSFLMKCDEVRCFSKASKDLIESVYGADIKTSLVPHTMKYFDDIAKQKINHNSYHPGEKLHVGVLGFLTEAKGLHIVEELLSKIDEENLPIDITLIGNTGAIIKSDSFVQTGNYELDQLPKIVEKRKIDIFLIPSVWPETFSYTTGEVMAMGYPVIVFDMGAPAERVREYEKGYVVNKVSADSVCEILINNVIGEKNE